METIRIEIVTTTSPELVWDAVRDVGALHTRLVRGFVKTTTLDGGVRIVTFADGLVVREPIVTIDAAAMRVVWGLESERLAHYSSSVQVHREGAGSRVVWTTDLLPDAAAPSIEARMNEGIAAMKRSLDATPSR